ncbi:unnamed protein product [Ostreobium quekettii]|uniref:Uncharacterized protein n=1 Tax=Ostreobium quekettii TaxID=121088 RepID=A0A8S1IKJ3_9CHLO|nr:unnamed protein product [Ostreobium quekettii]
MDWPNVFPHSTLMGALYSYRAVGPAVITDWCPANVDRSSKSWYCYNIVSTLMACLALILLSLCCISVRICAGACCVISFAMHCLVSQQQTYVSCKIVGLVV